MKKIWVFFLITVALMIWNTPYSATQAHVKSNEVHPIIKTLPADSNRVMESPKREGDANFITCTLGSDAYDSYYPSWPFTAGDSYMYFFDPDDCAMSCDEWDALTVQFMIYAPYVFSDFDIVVSINEATLVGGSCYEPGAQVCSQTYTISDTGAAVQTHSIDLPADCCSGWCSGPFFLGYEIVTTPPEGVWNLFLDATAIGECVWYYNFESAWYDLCANEEMCLEMAMQVDIDCNAAAFSDAAALYLKVEPGDTELRMYQDHTVYAYIQNNGSALEFITATATDGQGWTGTAGPIAVNAGSCAMFTFSPVWHPTSGCPTVYALEATAVVSGDEDPTNDTVAVPKSGVVPGPATEMWRHDNGTIPPENGIGFIGSPSYFVCSKFTPDYYPTTLRYVSATVYDGWPADKYSRCRFGIWLEDPETGLPQENPVYIDDHIWDLPDGDPAQYEEVYAVPQPDCPLQITEGSFWVGVSSQEDCVTGNKSMALSCDIGESDPDNNWFHNYGTGAWGYLSDVGGTGDVYIHAHVEYDLPDAEVELTPDYEGGGDDPGNTVEYVFTVENRGDDADTFDLSAVSDPAWTTQITDLSDNPITQIGPVASLGTEQFKVHVTVGADDFCETEVTATSQQDATAYDMSDLRTESTTQEAPYCDPFDFRTNIAPWTVSNSLAHTAEDEWELHEYVDAPGNGYMIVGAWDTEGIHDTSLHSPYIDCTTHGSYTLYLQYLTRWINVDTAGCTARTRVHDGSSWTVVNEWDETTGDQLGYALIDVTAELGAATNARVGFQFWSDGNQEGDEYWLVDEFCLFWEADVDITPSSITMTLPQGAADTAPVTVDNTGGSTLTYDIFKMPPYTPAKSAPQKVKMIKDIRSMPQDAAKPGEIIRIGSDQKQIGISAGQGIKANTASPAFKVPFKGESHRKVDMPKEMFDWMFGWNADVVTSSDYLMGCELVGENAWVVDWDAADPPTVGPHAYAFDAKTGSLLLDFDIPNQPDDSWIFDLAHDGANFWGGVWDDLNSYPGVIYSFTDAGMPGTPASITSTDLAADDYPVLGVAYDDDMGQWWIGALNSDIYRINASGATTMTLPYSLHGLEAVTGLAYDGESPGGPYLWIASQDVPGFEGGFAAYWQWKIGSTDPPELKVVYSAYADVALGAGLDFSSDFIDGYTSLVGLAQTENDVLFGIEVDGWNTCDPMFGYVAADGLESEIVSVTNDTVGLSTRPVGTYNMQLDIYTNDPDEDLIPIDVTLNVTELQVPSLGSIGLGLLIILFTSIISFLGFRKK